ncbi:group III truncated hemoglobin [Aquimarina sp. 2201CG5-10]|uniref:group III truncated hemoglobin n=1 Tax=Aquimarina callyspongiae TaxID=3098150 RepID=UPI002AB37DEE|nr:group III truncated hemoglobin [Aquimarina sp. 2201CG5-10]MDY8134498.1 group III truncated hemoglobin [Aquimarina sp. 2201CG5-10]
MRDITSREDIAIIMDIFYRKALIHPEIGHFFTEVAKIDLEEHLPHITNFWEQQLFRKGGYKKNVLQIHKNIHLQKSLEIKHFDTWLSLFNATIDQNFIGEKANLMKTRALSIATVIQLKIRSWK